MKDVKIIFEMDYWYILVNGMPVKELSKVDPDILAQALYIAKVPMKLFNDYVDVTAKNAFIKAHEERDKADE